MSIVLCNVLVLRVALHLIGMVYHGANYTAQVSLQKMLLSDWSNVEISWHQFENLFSFILLTKNSIKPPYL